MKPGPRHLITRPDPGQTGGGGSPAGTEAVISASAPTAPPPIKAAQNATTVDTRGKAVQGDHHHHQKPCRVISHYCYAGLSSVKTGQQMYIIQFKYLIIQLSIAYLYCPKPYWLLYTSPTVLSSIFMCTVLLYTSPTVLSSIYLCTVLLYCIPHLLS